MQQARLSLLAPLPSACDGAHCARCEPSTHAPTSSNQRLLQIVGVTAALRLHFAPTRRLFRPDASANLGSVYQRCESTRDCFCHACNAPADILQHVSQMNLGIQPRYCKHADGQKPAAANVNDLQAHNEQNTSPDDCTPRRHRNEKNS